ncbi:hypothetical protein [Streptomyces sp. NBC_01546]|uniref:hypothetical protein n=1 Tax=Streptomyces sp. NBC_01546 TaxID=2975872 RepID=UPI003867D5AF
MSTYTRSQRSARHQPGAAVAQQPVHGLGGGIRPPVLHGLEDLTQALCRPDQVFRLHGIDGARQ